LAFLGEQARDNMKTYSENKLPLKFEKYLRALEAVSKTTWMVVEQKKRQQSKGEALALVKDYTATTMDMLTNALVVVDDAVRFVEHVAEKLD
jgi:hypothetical protein